MAQHKKKYLDPEKLKKIGNQEAVVGNPDSTPLFKQV